MEQYGGKWCTFAIIMLMVDSIRSKWRTHCVQKIAVDETPFKGNFLLVVSGEEHDSAKCLQKNAVQG